MTDATDRAGLIAEARHWLLDPRDTHAGFLLVTDIYHALAQSERDLANARESGESYSRRLGKTVEQAVMNEERLRAKLAEQAAVIEAVRAWNRLTNGRPRYRELDQIINPEEWDMEGGS